MYGGYHGQTGHGQSHVPPGGIVPGTATGVNPYANNKPAVPPYLNNTPTTTSNFAPPPSFAPQGSQPSAGYVPHSGGQWNAGAGQHPPQQSAYGQTAPSGYQGAANPSGYGGTGAGFSGSAGYQQPALGGTPGYGSAGYGVQPTQQASYPAYGASASGGHQYSQSQEGIFNPIAGANRPTGYGQYSSPPPANVHPPPNTYAQPAPAQQAPQPSYGAVGQPYGAAYGQQGQQIAQPAHQQWPTAQPAGQQWGQPNQPPQTQGSDHGKRYSVASVSGNEGYQSYTSATPPPPAAPKPNRPGSSAAFFAPGTVSPPAQSMSQPPASKPSATASGFLGGGISDWEHYGATEGDDDEDLESYSKTSKKPETAPAASSTAVEMPAVTPPQTQKPFQQPPGGMNTSQAPTLPPKLSGPQGQNPVHTGQPVSGQWGALGPGGGQIPPGSQFQGYGQQGYQNPSVQGLQQPYRVSSPSQANQYGQGFNSQVPPNAGQTSPYGQPYPNSQANQPYGLNQQIFKQQEEERLRLQQEQENQLRKQQEEELRLRQQLEEERLRKQEEEERIRKQQEEDRLRQQEEERLRLQKEEEERLRKQEEERLRLQQQEEERLRKQREEEEAERLRKLQEQEAQLQRQREEEERVRQQQELQAQLQAQQQQQQQQQYGAYGPQGQSGQPPYGYQQPGQFPGPQAQYPQGLHGQMLPHQPGPYGQQYGHQQQPSLGGPQPIADPYAQGYLHQSQSPQSGPPGQYPGFDNRIQSPPAGQFGPPGPGHQKQLSMGGIMVVDQNFVQSQQPVGKPEMSGQDMMGPQLAGQVPGSDAVTGTMPIMNPQNENDILEIPSDLPQYYKDSIHKFVKMVIREASAKSSVDSLRIFTEFMEDETYSRGDRYSDVPLHDYISDVGKGYSFAGRRPYTTDSPDPYDVSRRTSGAVENPGGRRDSTLDSIDSPLTSAIEALRLGGRKPGQQDGTSVEHRLPYTIEEKDEAVTPLHPHHQKAPANVQGGTQSQVPVSGWATQPEPEPLELDNQSVQPSGPVQPLNVKRQSIVPHGASQANEGQLAHQAAQLGQQWQGPKPVSGQGESSGFQDGPQTTLNLQKRQSIPPGGFPIQSPGQAKDPHQKPPLQHRQSIPPEQFPSQSPAQINDPYQKPPVAQTTSSGQASSQGYVAYQKPAYQKPSAQQPEQPYSAYQKSTDANRQSQSGTPASFKTQSPPQGKDPYQQPAHRPSIASVGHSQTPPQTYTPFQQPVAEPSGYSKSSTQPLNFNNYAGPISPPQNELAQKPVLEAGRPQPPHGLDDLEVALDQGYVMVTPEPERNPVNPVAIQEVAAPVLAPQVAQPQASENQVSKVDLSALTTILGPDRNGLPDKLHLIAPLRQAIEAVGQDFSQIDKIRKDWEIEAKRVRDKNEAERDRLKSEHDEYTEELYSQQKIIYEDLHEIDEQFNAGQNALREKQEKEEFEKYIGDVFTPVYNMIQERIVELKRHQKNVLAAVKSAAAGREKYVVNNDKPHLQDTLVLLMDLGGILEAHFTKLQEAIADRDRRFKNTVLGPLYSSNNFSKLRDVKKHFEEEEKKAIIKGAAESLERAKTVKAAIHESMIPALDLEFGFFDEVEQGVGMICSALDPENPQNYGGDPKTLHDELAYGRTILDTLTQTQVLMMKLYHHVNMLVNHAERTVEVGQAKQRGEKPDAIQKIEDEKEASAKTLNDELKERLEDVMGHFGRAEQTVGPILAKLKAAFDQPPAEAAKT